MDFIKYSIKTEQIYYHLHKWITNYYDHTGTPEKLKHNVQAYCSVLPSNKIFGSYE